MNWYYTLYWLTRISELKWIVGSIAVWSMIFSIVLIICYFCIGSKSPDGEIMLEKKSLTKLRKIFIPLCITFSITWAFLPSQKDLVIIIAGGTIFNYIEKDSSLQAIPYELSSYLRESINELKNDSK